MQKNHSNGIGYRPMAHLASREFGKPINEKKMRRIMRDNDLQSTVRRKKYSDETYVKRRQLRDNRPRDLIERNFFALAPLQRLLVDITYLTGKDKTVYLNTIEDLYNGEILAWEIQDSPNSQLCMNTVMQLVNDGIDLHDVIIHSDLGSSYMSKEYRLLLERLGIRTSVGKVAVCYDNAAMESLNGIIKTEGLYCVWGKRNVRNKKILSSDLIAEVCKFIKWYNYDRLKKALGWMSPIEFRNQNPKGKYLVPLNLDNN